jgi:hypothetical protein
MRWLAEEWLRMAFEAAMQDDGAQGLGETEISNPKVET